MKTKLKIIEHGIGLYAKHSVYLIAFFGILEALMLLITLDDIMRHMAFIGAYFYCYQWLMSEAKLRLIHRNVIGKQPNDPVELADSYFIDLIEKETSNENL